MKPQELAAQSFHENQKLLSAVNTLSIHTKLEAKGRSAVNDEKAVLKAKDEVCSFLKELEHHVQDAENNKHPLLGIDPRRQQFVSNFIEAKCSYRIRSPFLRDKLSEAVHILRSEKPFWQNSEYSLKNIWRVMLASFSEVYSCGNSLKQTLY